MNDKDTVSMEVSIRFNKRVISSTTNFVNMAMLLSAVSFTKVYHEEKEKEK